MKTSVKMLVLGLVAVLVGSFGVLSASRSEAANDGKTILESSSVLVAATQKTLPATTEEEQADETDEELCSIGLECHVDSRVNAYVRVYINGIYRGTMAPYGDIFPFVGDLPGGVTTLYAVTSDGRFTWNRTVYNDVGNFHWILYP